MLDTKKGNCTIFAAKIKAWNHTTDLCLCFFVAKTVFSLDAANNQLYFGCAVCSSCLNFAYCAITYVASGEYVIRTKSFKLHASGRFQ